jgi:hypothetical protein
MGLISKAKTASRTAEKSVTNILGGGNGVDGLEDTDLVIRAAGAQIGAVSRRSSMVRGHTTNIVTGLGIGALASDFWFLRLEWGVWELTLGADSSAGVAIDWQVRCASVLQAGEPMLTITTPNGLTSNGALVKGDAHDSLRQLIVDGVSGIHAPDRAAMTDISEAGYATTTNWLCNPTPSAFSDAFVITTSLSCDDTRLRVSLIQARCSQVEPDTWVYQIGVVGQAAATATIRIHDAGAHREIYGSVQFTPTGKIIGDEVAYRGASSFAASVLATVKLWKAEAELARPAVQSGGSHG